MGYTLTYNQLYKDLYKAYLDARRHKRKKEYQKRFEKKLFVNLHLLCKELYTRTWKPRASMCFIITDPKKREVFAANFRDRIVHHLYYNYTHELYERTFIADTYSCIKKRGTHYGVDRLYQHILRESQGYKVSCYVLKMDISGYFMNINRKLLLDICLSTLSKMRYHNISKFRSEKWNDELDFDFVEYLTQEIVLLNPLENCFIKGRKEDWSDLPKNKSLFYTPDGCGLPIGNLTSQLFSNVYLNVLDQYVKRTLKAKHYGRYVDDFYIVSADKEFLYFCAEEIKVMLREKLGLTFHEGKMKIVSSSQGVEFLGMFVKHHRKYISKETLWRMRIKLKKKKFSTVPQLKASLQSYKGVLSHGNNYMLQENLMFYTEK